MTDRCCQSVIQLVLDTDLAMKTSAGEQEQLRLLLVRLAQGLVDKLRSSGRPSSSRENTMEYAPPDVDTAFYNKRLRRQRKTQRFCACAEAAQTTGLVI